MKKSLNQTEINKIFWATTNKSNRIISKELIIFSNQTAVNKIYWATKNRSNRIISKPLIIFKILT